MFATEFFNEYLMVNELGEIVYSTSKIYASKLNEENQLSENKVLLIFSSISYNCHYILSNLTNHRIDRKM